MEIKMVTGRYAGIANRLRAVRQHYNMRSKDFAEQADVNTKSYSQWESGDIRCSLDGALRLCDRYGISLDFIYFGSLDTLPNKIAADLSSSPLVKNSKVSIVNPDT